LQGVLRILGCFVVVNRGEFVVECVVKRGELTTTFRGRKTCHFFQIYFWLLFALRAKLSHDLYVLLCDIGNYLRPAVSNRFHGHQV
jgi:hypothetical protein